VGVKTNDSVVGGEEGCKQKVLEGKNFGRKYVV
jgi:hypothetical protein